MRGLIALFLLAASGMAAAQPAAASPRDACGEVVKIATHDGTTTPYAYTPAQGMPATDTPVTLVLLVGGGGYVDLDDRGCPQLLSRNALIRMSPLFRQVGMATALVDAPSDMRGDEGLGGFRIAAGHADDLGRVIADLRARTRGTVWIAGHSRGTLSAANTAARLTGSSAPDGVVLLSAMMVGDARAKKPWVAQTLFSVDLEAIRVPLLLVGHAADNCVRSPPDLMATVATKTRGARQQAVTVTGGPVPAGRPPGLAACEVREPHDFVTQEAELAAGMMRFIRGGSY